MRWRRIIHLGMLSALLAGPASSRGEEPQDAESLKFENKQLRKELSDFENRVRDMQRELDLARAAVVLAQMEADQAERRCRKLQDELTWFRTGKPVDRPSEEAPAKVVRPAAAKARPALARGKITAVGKDGRLVQISVGAEAGVKEGQALEVYRIGNGAQRVVYLGAVTLTRVDPQAALGEFKSVTGADYRPGLGDEVATEFVVK